MFTNSNLDNLDKYVSSVTKSGEYEGRIESTCEITVQEYINEFAGLMYRKMFKTGWPRMKTTYSYEFGCTLVTLVSDSNGYKTRYQFHPKED